jgi:predicted  nucleic acid-binding Zn-ribbon protein
MKIPKEIVKKLKPSSNTFIVSCPSCEGRIVINLKMHHVEFDGKQERLF